MESTTNITQSDIERLKEIFVTRKECDENNKSIQKAVEDIKIDLAVIKDNQKTQRWLMRTILGAIITLIVGAFAALLTRGGI